MEFFIAELFDYFFEIPMIVGVFTTEEQASDAIDIVVEQLKRKDPRRVPDSRFVPTITPVTVNGFTPAVMDFLGSE